MPCTVTLTAAGHEALVSRNSWQRAREEAFLATLTPDARALAPDLLLRLAGLIDELAAGPQASDPVCGTE